jgi:hypothetical protein
VRAIDHRSAGYASRDGRSSVAEFCLFFGGLMFVKTDILLSLVHSVLPLGRRSRFARARARFRQTINQYRADPDERDPASIPLRSRFDPASIPLRSRFDPARVV